MTKKRPAIDRSLSLSLLLNLHLHTTSTPASSQLPFGLPPSAGFACIGALHVLLWLACNWSVRIAALVGFTRAPSVASATHVLARAAGPGGGVSNNKASGSVAEIVPLDVRAFPGGGAPVPGFDVARTRYAWDVWRGSSGSSGGNDENDNGNDDGRDNQPSPPPPSCRFAQLRYPDSACFAAYAAGSYSSGLSPSQAASVLEAYGPNACPVPVPTFSELLKEQLIAPFFVFQVFCVGLWTLDEYWVYSAFTLLMLVGFESTVVGQRLRNLTELRGLQAPKPRVSVYRGGKWTTLPGEALVPGDLVSLGGGGGNKGRGAASSSSSPSNNNSDGGSESAEVPADCLLLAGRAVVEEAALTGESAPQWKAAVYESAAAVAAAAAEDGTASVGEAEAATEEEDDERGEEGPKNLGDVDLVPGAVFNVDPRARLDLARHKHHVLFSGTKILQHGADAGAKVRTPDGGCLAVVLRTGFEAAQGRMVRTILSAAGRVTAASWEAGAFICLLLVFAVAAAAHVLRVGLADKSRDRFKLYLHCVMIVTSVVPPELPMELTIAVNASLLALARRGVFCTEPFRIPVAGGVSTACFDKTGTLTSDEMVLEGVAPASAAAAAEEEGERGREGRGGRASAASAAAAVGPLVAAHRAPTAAQLVLAACHSLAPTSSSSSPSSRNSDGYSPPTLAGDPLERAAFGAVRWAMVATGDGGRVMRPGTAPGAGGSSPGTQRVTSTVLRRYHFSASLRRMSVVLAVDGCPREDERAFVDGQVLASSPPSSPTSSSAVVLSTTASPALVVATKGAPEAVRSLLTRVPPGYDAAASAFAARGGRVLALAVRLLTAKKKRKEKEEGEGGEGAPAVEVSSITPSRARALSRAEAESGLTFVGFAVLGCPMRPESAPALRELADSGHDLVMITGDAPLTACHVARELGIVSSSTAAATATATANASSSSSSAAAAARPTIILQRAAGAPEAIAGVVEGEHGAGADPDSFFEWVVAEVEEVENDDGGTECDDGDENVGAANGGKSTRTGKKTSPSHSRRPALPYVRPGLPGDAASLALSHDLCVTGDGLSHAQASSSSSSARGGNGQGHVDHASPLIAVTRVFARVSPDQKEAILDSLRLSGATTLMCGDGTNDVGALKAAHVGVALLPPRTLEQMQQIALQQRQQQQQQQLARQQHGRGGHATQQQRAAAATASATSPTNGQQQQQPRQLAGQKMLAELRSGGRPVDARAERMASWLDKLDAASGGGGDNGGLDDTGGPPLVRPGDASAAAPFTAKAGGALACADIVRQGRAALVTTVQMFKILGLLSLSSAYALSVMYLAGVKLSDGQATAQGVLSAALFFLISQAAPAPALSQTRPHASVFTKYAMLSLVGQAIAHMGLLAWAHSKADALMVAGAAEAAREAAAEAEAEEAFAAELAANASMTAVASAVSASSVAAAVNSTLLGNATAAAIASNATMTAAEYLALARSPDGAFTPNLVNTVAYLVNCALMITTFGANYVGDPFCTPLTSNSTLGKTLSYGAFGVSALLLGLVPGANRALSLVRLPRRFAASLVCLCAANAAWCVGVERALRAAFPARSGALLPRPGAAANAAAASNAADAAAGEGAAAAPSASRKSRAEKKDD